MGFLKTVLVILITSIFYWINPLQVLAAEDTLLYDDFNDGNYNGWTVKLGNWSVENGFLKGAAIGQGLGGQIDSGNPEWNNFRLELDVRGESGVDQYVVFRYTSNGYYGINLRYGTGNYDTPQIKFWKMDRNNSTLLANTHSLPLVNQKWYHVKIEALNGNITIWIDDTLIFDITDTDTEIKNGNISLSYSTGSVGIANMRFDNIRVTALPKPFLDLPWDYKGQGNTFNYMALNPFSWFDHQYPLQNLCPPCNPPVMNYTGQTINSPYRSHNGYDYSFKNGIILNTPVLAAATGSATFKPWDKSGGAGNVIKIDHGNGYQTWYEHLSKDGLVISTEGQEVHVEQGQQIGLVGMTGNTDGPHIHFSVFKDSNNNSSFSDDYPFGVTDPLGWEGKTVDPWSSWTNGTRTGTTSYNLFLPASPYKSALIPPGGGTLTADDTIISVPAGALNSAFTIVYKIGPFESLSDFKTGVTPSFSLNAYINGQPVTQFLKPIKITLNYSKANLTNINENTIKFNYFNEQTQTWDELPTTRNTLSKTITTEMNHFTRFAVTGDAIDLIPPTTAIQVTGDEGGKDWYHTPVTIELQAQDNEGGLGMEYTLYSLNGNDWSEYATPLVFDADGNYQIIYQSYDKAENQEEEKILEFRIVKNPLFFTQYRWGLPTPGYSYKWPIFESWQQAQVQNLSPESLSNIKATISSTPPNMSFVNGQIDFGTITASSSAWSTNNFKVRTDLSKPANKCDGITWQLVYDDSLDRHHILKNIPQFPPGKAPGGCP